MRKFNLICLWIALFLSSVLRAGVIDSLEVELASQTDAKRIDILNELAWHYQNTNANEAMSFANLALKESRELNYVEGHGRALQRKGVIHLLKHENKQALKHLLNAASIYTNSNDFQELSKSYLSIGNVYMNLEEFNEAKKYYQKAQDICIKNGFLDQYEIIANNIGAVQENFELYEEALSTYRNALRYSDSSKQNFSNLLLNMGSAHFYNNNTDSALYYTNVAKLRFNAAKDTNGLIKSWLNEAVFYESDELYRKAIPHYRKAGALAQQLGDVDSEFDIEQGLMLCFGALGEVDSMYAHFENGLVLSDKLIGAKTDKALHELGVKYETAQKEADLIKSEREKEFETEKSRLKQQTIYYLLAIIGVIALLLVLLYLFFKQKENASNLKVKVINNEIESLMKNQELQMYQSLIEGQDTERKRISEDLHDRIGGLLAAINLQFEGAEEDQEKRIQNVRSLVNESIKEVRSISHNLSDGRIEQVGLVPAIQGLNQSLVDSGKIKVDLFAENYNSHWSIEVEREVYKIILELISNTLKHANATGIVIQLNAFKDHVQLMFEDNGKGFNLNDKRSGLGLRTIEQRVLNLSGELNIDSKQGYGTTVIIEIPIT